MAKSSITLDVTVTLELNEDEATWLRSVMQTPLYDDENENEEPDDRKYRETLFTALDVVNSVRL